tara:strand:- start:1489 stop:2604 length:1116 start_codon:yes stop_codon:yes gene_type:complete
MNKYYYLIFIICLFSCKTKKQETVKQKKTSIKKEKTNNSVKVLKSFYSSFKGEIDNEEAVLFLANNNGKITGGYYYSFQINEYYPLKGTVDSIGNIELTEKENKIAVAQWKGVFKEKELVIIERTLNEDKSKMQGRFSSFKMCKYSFTEHQKIKEIKEEMDSSELIISFINAEGCQVENQENTNYLIKKEFNKYLKVKSLEEKIKKFHSMDLYDDMGSSLLIKETEEHKIKEVKPSLSNIVSLTFSSYNYIQGTPYPNSSFKIIHINTENNQLVSVNDFLDIEKKSKFNLLLEKEFLDQNKEIEESIDFILPTNFIFNNKGVVYKFKTYELGPRAIGNPTFFVSYSKLIPFLSDSHLAHRIRAYSQLKQNL